MTSILPLIGRRVLVSVVILLIVSALLFCILRLLPVDPAAMSLPPNATLAEIEAKRREMGLDQPLFRQYLIWLAQVVHGDFGASIHFRRGVAGLITSTLPATIELALLMYLRPLPKGRSYTVAPVIRCDRVRSALRQGP